MYGDGVGKLGHLHALVRGIGIAPAGTAARSPKGIPDMLHVERVRWEKKPTVTVMQ